MWQSSGNGSANELLRWYPGDEYVDWLGYSYFDGNPRLIGNGILQLARRKDKPVFICESAPRKDVKKSDPDMLWEDWYVPFLAHIERNRDVIQMVHYINCDWESRAQWAGQGWGDSRMQANETLKTRWIEVLNGPLFSSEGENE